MRLSRKGDFQGQSPSSSDFHILKPLKEMGILSDEQSEIILKEHVSSGSSISELLIAMHFVTEDILLEIGAKMWGVESLSLRHMTLDTNLICKVPQTVCLQHVMIPVSQTQSEIKVAMADVEDLKAMDQIRFCLAPISESNITVVPVLATRADILEAIQTYYGFENSPLAIFQELESHFSGEEDGHNAENPTIRFANAFILDAVKCGASDIHYEPEAFFVRVRYRVDGVLRVIFSFHKKYWSSLCVRLKVMASMDIAESRRPQSGRFSLSVMGREVDFRLSCHPTYHGENLVLRILDKRRSLITLENLGYNETVLELLKRCLQKPEGLMIVTGPTGCGKTTALYSMLSFFNTDHVNIMTLEEPLEYRLPLIRQTDIHERAGITFAEGIRSILHQDPDIILIGEIRDAEAAAMALRASMTGHQVLTTLHTSDAVGAVFRLLDLGLSYGTLAGNLSCILAQRLIRRLCPDCKVSRAPTAQEQYFLKISSQDPVWMHTGCEQCRQTGYCGRMVLAELMIFDEGLNALLVQEASRAQIYSYLVENGFRSLKEDGIAAILRGETTTQEVSRSVGLY